MIEWKSVGRFLAPAALVLALPGAAFAAEACLDFEGLRHCAVGGASLSQDAAGLRVNNGGTGGQGGVHIQMDGATAWSIGSIFQGGNASFVSTAFAEGEAVSSMILREEGNGVSARATFTGAAAGSTYSVLVYSGGQLQAAVGNVGTTGTTNFLDGEWYWDPVTKTWRWRPRRPRTTGFGNHRLSGACIHTLGYDSAVNIRLPNGQLVQGDRVEFVEEVPGSGSYAYLSFDAMQVTGSFESLTITSESVQR
jgi:hypothetical protein